MKMQAYKHPKRVSQIEDLKTIHMSRGRREVGKEKDNGGLLQRQPLTQTQTAKV